MLRVHNTLQNVTLGVVYADEIRPSVTPPILEQELDSLLTRRARPLSDIEDARRRLVRDMLRHGRYKPTGRGKPASEYLVRAAQRAATEDGRPFPRINGPVDACNFISLASLLPLSLWDVDRAASTTVRFGRGAEGEAFIFNTGGQRIDLQDLLVGWVWKEETWVPIVNPVKDSLATKLQADTRRVAGVIYAPEGLEPDDLQYWTERFAALLEACGAEVAARHALVAPQDEVTL